MHGILQVFDDLWKVFAVYAVILMLIAFTVGVACGRWLV